MDPARELLVSAPNDDLRALITAHRAKQREQAGKKKPQPQQQVDASTIGGPSRQQQQPARGTGMRGPGSRMSASTASLLNITVGQTTQPSTSTVDDDDRLVLGGHAAYNVFKTEEGKLRSRIKSGNNSRSPSPSPKGTPTRRRRNSRTIARIYDAGGGAAPQGTMEILAPDIFDPKQSDSMQGTDKEPSCARGRRRSRAGMNERQGGESNEGKFGGPSSSSSGAKLVPVAARQAEIGGIGQPDRGHVRFSTESKADGSQEMAAKEADATPEKKEKKARHVYDEYWTAKKVSAGLKSGELLRGKLRINQNKTNDAYVPVERFARDVYVGGMRGRNRALDGDTVVIRLLPRHQWRIMEREWHAARKAAAGASISVDIMEAPTVTTSTTTLDPLTSAIPSTPSVSDLGPDSDKLQYFGFLRGPSQAMAGAKGAPTSVGSRTNSSLSIGGPQSGPSRQQHQRGAGAQPPAAPAGAAKKKDNDYAHAAVPDEYLQPAGTVVFVERKALTTFTGHLRPYKPFSSADDDVGGAGRGTQSIERTRSPSPSLHRSSVADQGRRESTTAASSSFSKGASRSTKRERRASVQGDGSFVDPKCEHLLASFLLSEVDAAHVNPHEGALALFVPLDRRLPRMSIDGAACPAGFFGSPSTFARTLFSARLVEWRADSELATGALLGTLGQSGEIEAETAALLAENDVDTRPFPAPSLACLPDKDWAIPQTEVQHRKDYRLSGTRIFSIDPATAKDIDDALHCIANKDGTFEVGVHIADVSYFVEQKTALDHLAENRGTTVYLVDRAIPMLPARLSEDLCSLNPMADRLAFSIVWRLSAKGDILSEWIGRTIIHSCCKLSYDTAQAMIDLPEGPSELWGAPEVEFPHHAEDVMKDVLNLNRLAKNLRRARFDGGALRLDRARLSFKTDKATGLPESFHTYEIRDSNRLIEEFMLLANMSVAKRVYASCPGLALLRSHPKPLPRKMDEFIALCASAGVQLNGQTAGTLQHSLDDFLAKKKDGVVHAAVQMMATRPMQTAQYFCTGAGGTLSEFRHYALNCGLYTHFTSPIRRYADIIVHRLLAASLGIGPAVSLQTSDIASIATHCNDRKSAAKKAQEQSEFVFLCVYLSSYGPVQYQGVVTNVMDRSFEVVVPALGIQSRVWCDDLPLEEYTWSEKERELCLVWKPAVHKAGVQKGIAAIKAKQQRRDSKAAVSMRAYRRRASEMNLERPLPGAAGPGHGLASLSEPSEEAGESRAPRRSISVAVGRTPMPMPVTAANDGVSRAAGVSVNGEGELTTRIRLLAKLKVSVSANMRRIPAEVSVAPVRPDPTA